MSLEDSQRKKNYSKSNAMMRSLKDQAEDKKKYKKWKKEKNESRDTNVGSIHPPAPPLTVRGDTEALIGKGNLSEKIIKIGLAFNKKQAEKRKKKIATKQMKSRAKKLTAYESYT